MPESEYQYLIDTFDTEIFNLHSTDEFPLKHPLSNEIRARIFIENTRIGHALSPRELSGFAGICFDLSHLEDTRRNSPARYREMLALTAAKPVGANHISAVTEDLAALQGKWRLYSKHEARRPADFEYISGLDPRAFAHLCAIELENPLREQLEFLPIIRRAIESAKQVLKKAA